MPATLRVRSIPGGVEIRSPSRRIYVLAAIFAIITAAMVALGGALAIVALLPLVLALGLLAVAVFVTIRPTRLSFAGDRFVCGKLTHLTADIASFAVGSSANRRIEIVTKSGVRIPLPVGLDDVTVTVKPGGGGDDTTYGAAPREVAEDIVGRLEEALSEVRSAPTMFRVAASGPRIAEERVAEEDVEDEKDSQPLERRGAS